jgi:DNA-binding CsgD family transcriptional regulator
VQGVPIPRPSGKPPLLARVFPGAGLASLDGCGAVRVAIVIDDPLDPAALPDVALLRSQFGLTPAEAAVARLLAVTPVRTVLARELGLSENTVKTHLAAIRAKLAVRTSAEAAQIVSRLGVGP